MNNKSLSTAVFKQNPINFFISVLFIIQYYKNGVKWRQEGF